MKKAIYLDYAAATPVDPEVLKAMQPYFSEEFYNPSATYLAAEKVRQDLEAARAQAAQILGARQAEIIFTAGATEANNLAIRGVMEQFLFEPERPQSRRPDGNVVVSAIEHDSVLEPAKKFNCKIAPVDKNGVVDLKKLESLIDEKTLLVSVMYASNEVGSIEPIKEIAQIIQKKRTQRAGQKLSSIRYPLFFHTDAAQAGNYLDLHVSRLGVDLMSLNGGKIYGPKQSGALFVGSRAKLAPIILGGGQERGLRSGTENVTGSIGLAKALETAQNMCREESQRLVKLQQLFIDDLKNKIPGVIINGSPKHRLPNNIHITLPGQDNERLLFALDEAGIMAAAGSACSASNEEPSHVLKAMGVSDKDAQSSLRFTMGRQTAEADIQKTVQVLSSLVE